MRLTDGRLLVQWDRLVHGSTGKLGNARGNGPGLLDSELAYAQLGRVGDQTVLRVAGEGRQWLLNLAHANPQQVLDLVVTRAEKARKDRSSPSRTTPTARWPCSATARPSPTSAPAPPRWPAATPDSRRRCSCSWSPSRA
ncbi:hypothetical protein QRX50_00375 [Amycolatopsis carbonis]|uniref:Uncharacterized protein n=1 Tax=Amycolatopsis carbonis TaxID=715471 RepID=A0A9Y2IH15_9PSEU|nr:hypothetical protein [Amycolatopsis sp. 2-15]WIX79309.1 hypothetical protein QRX50_00375 [Amycolatopsis sp. 2-15]